MPGICSDFAKWAVGLDLLEFRAPNLWSKLDCTSVSYFKCEFSLYFLYLKMKILSLARHSLVRTTAIQIVLFCSFKMWTFVDHHGTQVGTMGVTYLTDSCYECFKQHCELLAAVSYQEEINCEFIKCWSQFHPGFTGLISMKQCQGHILLAKSLLATYCI